MHYICLLYTSRLAENALSASATYPGVQAGEALSAFSASRAWNLRLIGGALPGAAKRPVTHPERGTMTFLTLVETMAGHDLNHLAQLKKLAEG